MLEHDATQRLCCPTGKSAEVRNFEALSVLETWACALDYATDFDAQYESSTDSEAVPVMFDGWAYNKWSCRRGILAR